VTDSARTRDAVTGIATALAPPQYLKRAATRRPCGGDACVARAVTVAAAHADA
jgi:hypothetical protein